VARLNEDRVALARFGRDRGRDDQAKFDLAVVAGSVRTQQATRLTCATADPNCCHLGCTARAPWATKLPAPSQARAVGPAELTVRRRCPVGSRTIGVVALNEHRETLARLDRERGRDDQTQLDSAVVAGSVRTQQATRLTCATADPNCCHLGCTARALWATKLPAPSQARAVGPAELTVRRRCPKGSRTIGLVTLNEHRQTLAGLARDRGRGDQVTLGSSNRLDMNEIGDRPLA
jgi:uncharacterized Fe-S cluster-containing radical SAM superfamily protein